jgi:hypothetical protein
MGRITNANRENGMTTTRSLFCPVWTVVEHI